MVAFGIEPSLASPNCEHGIQPVRSGYCVEMGSRPNRMTCHHRFQGHHQLDAATVNRASLPLDILPRPSLVSARLQATRLGMLCFAQYASTRIQNSRAIR